MMINVKNTTPKNFMASVGCCQKRERERERERERQRQTERQRDRYKE